MVDLKAGTGYQSVYGNEWTPFNTDRTPPRMVMRRESRHCWTRLTEWGSLHGAGGRHPGAARPRVRRAERRPRLLRRHETGLGYRPPDRHRRSRVRRPEPDDWHG